MDFSFDKYISIVYRLGLLSSGLDAVLGKGWGLMNPYGSRRRTFWLLALF